MRLEEIPDSILATENPREKEWGIKTTSVVKIFQLGGVAYFEGHKSDGTSTMFVAIRLAGKRNPYRNMSWRWFCPDKDQTLGLARFSDFYDEIERTNRIVRERGGALT